MASSGAHNDLTDIQGLLVGGYQEFENVCGLTVVICPQGAVGGVDVRGSAPGTRETDLLAPTNLVERVNAVALCGGSVYGLGAVDGVVKWLADKGWGFPLEQGHVAPIVPAAALFDLGRGPNYVPPTGSEWGRRACDAAGPGPIPLGSAGAGAGALAGGIKGGLGSASLVLDSGLGVAALMAVNSLGSVINPASGRPWEIGQELGGELGDQGQRSVALPPAPQGQPAANTTIGVVATDAMLTKAQAQKIAQMSHDGMARAIRPAHTMFDGDTIFCLATGTKPLPEMEGFFTAPQAPALNQLGAAAADCVSRAIMRAVLSASSLGGMIAWQDLPDR